MSFSSAAPEDGSERGGGARLAGNEDPSSMHRASGEARGERHLAERHRVLEREHRQDRDIRDEGAREREYRLRNSIRVGFAKLTSGKTDATDVLFPSLTTQPCLLTYSHRRNGILRKAALVTPRTRVSIAVTLKLKNRVTWNS